MTNIINYKQLRTNLGVCTHAGHTTVDKIGKD